MKKLFALLLAAMMVFALAACGNSDTPDPSDGKTPSSDPQQENNTLAPGTDEPDNSGGGEADAGEISLDNVTNSNYAAIAKELFGIEVDPEGDWELVKADSTGTIGGGIGIVYQGSATVDIKELMKTYYDATADISTAGICIGKVDSDSPTGMRISEPFADFDAFYAEGTKANGAVGEWIYEFGGKKIEFMFALNPEMELTLQINFVADHIYG